MTLEQSSSTYILKGSDDQNLNDIITNHEIKELNNSFGIYIFVKKYLIGYCNGNSACGTCAVHITHNYDLLEQPSKKELELVDCLFNKIEKYDLLYIIY